ncbi:MAG: SRPBCC family protein [Hyphomicrobiales bacterium]|nr:SRPBCC family protein [Hyphomicrobiales bacterium]MCP5000651.1 SRPBCC family protein [Hyphomicrobiales bacterium]
MIRFQSNARPLRAALSANGVFSLLSGGICIADSDTIAGLLFAQPFSLLGFSSQMLFFELGIGLLAFGAFVLWTALQRTISRGRAKIITIMDAGWVLASLDLLFFMSGLWTTTGTWIVGGTAAIIGTFAAEQLFGLAVLYQGQNEVKAKTDGRRLTLTATAITSASPERVWQVMSHHEAYADVADNLSKVEVLRGTGADTERRCTDTKGKSWNETCTLWEEGRAYAFRVHTDAPDYPYPIAQLNGKWLLDPVPGGTRITMIFKVTGKSGLLNGLIFRLMAAPFSSVCDRLLTNWIAVMEDTAASDQVDQIAQSGYDAAMPA